MSTPKAKHWLFGDAPPPAPSHTKGLPPNMVIASQQLAAAINEPPSLGDKWPFADTPLMVANRAAREAAAKAKGGRPSDIKPHQVVRLVRFVKLGDSVKVAAEKAGIKERAARLVLAGRSEIAHHPAVTAAGVFLPARNARRNPGETSTSPGTPAAGTTAAPPSSKTPQTAGLEGCAE